MEVFSQYIDKLRSSGLRPTKQRLMISKLIKKKLNKTVSLATIYNTVKDFKKKGYLKEIPLEGNKTYFDTNTSSHHHFYDEDTEKLTDIDNKEIYVNKVPATPSGKSIKSMEVMVRIASDNHNQK